MTTVVLCSAGPSLRDQLRASPLETVRPEHVIAVNTAASVVRADYWACMDAHRFDEIEPIGTPPVVSFDDQIIRMQSMHAEKAKAFKFIDILHIMDQLGAPRGWLNYTYIAGLIFSRHLGARRLVIYGVDMAGGECCLGHDMSKYRRPERWTNERQLEGVLIEWLERTGTAIERITPVESSCSEQAQA